MLESMIPAVAIILTVKTIATAAGMASATGQMTIAGLGLVFTVSIKLAATSCP